VAAPPDGLDLRVWDATGTGPSRDLQGHKGRVTSVAVSPDGRRFATTSEDRTLRIWDAETGQSLAVLRGHGDTASCAAFSADGRTLLSVGQDGRLLLWDGSPP
jgi:eukaryotic-like serine/threonine-protein kinase